MDQITEKKFERHFQEIIKTAVERYGIATEPVKKLGSFESAVYEVTRDGKPCILKATSRPQRPDPYPTFSETTRDSFVYYHSGAGYCRARSLVPRFYGWTTGTDREECARDRF